MTMEQTSEIYNHNPPSHRTRRRHKIISNMKLSCWKSSLLTLNITIIIIIIVTTISSQNYLVQSQTTFQDVSHLKPKVMLIVPQTFKLATNYGQVVSGEQSENFVALINYLHESDRHEQMLRNLYPKLVLQVRDASRGSQNGELIYEHVFDYFSQSQNHLLLPINLEQLSHFGPSTNDKHNNKHNQNQNLKQLTKDLVGSQVVVSVRPHRIESGFGGRDIELVSSSPIEVELIQSRDGRRSIGLIQTDKPIYKPSEKVRIRCLVVNESLRPVLKDEIKLQIKNPHKIIVEEIKFPNEFSENKTNEYYFEHIFEFPPEPMLGGWSVHLLHRDPIANDTSFFEVREYSLPTFDILFDGPKYVVPNSDLISGHIIAKHHYGRPIKGTAQFKFGLRETPRSPIKWVARSNIKDVDPQTGKVNFRISTDKIKSYDWFPSIAGSRFVIEASVIESSTGHTEVSQDTSCLFTSSPYRISFDDSIVDFRPGMTQSILVKLIDLQTGRAAGPDKVKLNAQYKNLNNTDLSIGSHLQTEAMTNSQGQAIFNIGPLPDSLNGLIMFVSATTNHSSSDAAQFNISNQHTILKHESTNGWILIMNKTITDLQVGQYFESDLSVHDGMLIPDRIFYVIVARSSLLMLKALDSDGLMRFLITESMVPSVRIVLFAITQDRVGLLSDSMRLNVNQDLHCGMKLKFEPIDTGNSSDQSLEPASYWPNTQGRVLVESRKGDLLSLTGVDSAIYSLTNTTHTESIRIIERLKRLDSGCGFGGGRNYLDVFLNSGLMLFRNVADEQQVDGLGKKSLPVGSSCLTVQNQLRQLEDMQLGFRRPAVGLSYAGALANSNRLRNKRDVIDKLIEETINRYQERKLKACCKLGTYDDMPNQRNCSLRAMIVHHHMSINGQIDEADSCSEAYINCCKLINEYLAIANVVPISARNLDDQMIATNVEGEIKRHVNKHVQLMASPPLHYSDPSDILNMGHLDKIESETLIRRDFRETWLFELANTDDRGMAKLDVTLPHSMTSWSLWAMALNQDKAMCFMKSPLKLTTFKEIFIQLTMPFKVVQGEQIDLVATVFNYSPNDLNVVVYTYGVDGICSDAEAGERSARRVIRLIKHSSQSLVYPIIPLKVGKYPIKLLAISERSNTSDIIERELNVVARGRPVTDEITFSLDPLNQQRRAKRAIKTGNLIDEIDPSKGLQKSRIELIPTRDVEWIVPQTQECIVSAVGDRMGNTVQTAMLDVENLIKMPHGCGEQVMIYMGPTLYTAKYLSSINRFGGDLRWRAIRYLQDGYKRILNFRQESGAFSAFPGREPSLWLSAFVTKLLCQTERRTELASQVRIDPYVVKASLAWLIDQQNSQSGAWHENNPVYHREMLGGVLRENALTAFVVITLNECQHHADSRSASPTSGDSSISTSKFRSSLNKAEELLVLNKYRASKEKNVYVMALTAYALSFSRPREATETLNDLWRLAERNHGKNYLFWTGDYAIETSGYALSSLVELAPLIAGRSNSSHVSNDAQAIANWLTTRRSYSGAFESTQDTMVALEALSKLAQLQSSASSPFNFLNQNNNNNLTHSKSITGLSCQVIMSNRTRRSIEFDRENAQVMQTFKVEPGQNMGSEILEIITSGNGLGIMSVKLKYNVLQEEDDICHFYIDSSIEEWRDKIVLSQNNHAHNSDGVEKSSSNKGDEDDEDDSNQDSEYFNQFSQPMLKELNLIYHIDSNKKEQQASSLDKPKLRFRRQVYLENQSFIHEKSPDNWASRIITSIKSKVTSWFGGKSDRSMKQNRPDLIAGNDTHLSGSGLVVPRRHSNTSRRATQNAPPLIVRPTGIPLDAKFNKLADNVELVNTTILQMQKNNNNSSNIHTTSSVIPVNTASTLINQIRICVNHISSRRDSDMAVIEIGILSGFQPNEGDLKQIVEQPGSLAMKYELSNDRSLVIFYVRYIPSGAPFCLQFRQVRESHVHNLQSGYIRVYEYYNPTRACSAYYTPVRQAESIETRCDQSSQVCECAARSTCPGLNGKMRDLGQIQLVNSTSARNQFKDLVCSPRFDFVSLLQLRDVREVEPGKYFRLSMRVKFDFRGNLSRIMSAQRLHNAQSSSNMPKLVPPDLVSDSETSDQLTSDSMDSLTLIIDSSCVRNDPLLLHLAHQNQWRKFTNSFILFGKYSQISRRYLETSKRVTRSQPIASSKQNLDLTNPKTNETKNILNEDGDKLQKLQYSTRLHLNNDAILHNALYNVELDEALSGVNTLVKWLDIQIRHESWKCSSHQKL